MDEYIFTLENLMITGCTWVNSWIVEAFPFLGNHVKVYASPIMLRGGCGWSFDMWVVMFLYNFNFWV